MFKAKLLKHKLLFIGGTLIVILAIAGFALFSAFSQPVSVNVSASSNQSSAIKSYHIDLTPTPETNKFATFNYPRGLTLKSTTLLTPSSVADYKFYVKDTYSWVLSIDISDIPDGALSSLSSYQLREENPSQYKQQSETLNGKTITVFTDSEFPGGFSKLTYLTDGDFVSTVSLTGDDSSGTGPLETSFSMVINSWHWN